MDFKVYHVFSKSIVEFRIFNNETEFQRMTDITWYYQTKKPPIKFSWFNDLDEKNKHKIKEDIASKDATKLVDIIAYCFMPTHVHMVLRQLEEKGISIFMKNILNSYTRYFNSKHNRKGPLWEGRFKKVEITNDEQLLHLTRYVHLNPVTAYLVDKPELWPASSYREYVAKENKKGICTFAPVLDIMPDGYKRFTEDQISYQRELASVTKHLFD